MKLRDTFDKLLELLSGSGPGDFLSGRSEEPSPSVSPTSPAVAGSASSRACSVEASVGPDPAAAAGSTPSSRPFDSAASPDTPPSSVSPTSPAATGMSVEEWKALLWEAHRQRVMGLLADAVAALPYEKQPPLAIRAKLALELEVIEKKNLIVNAAARELVRIFEESGFHPVIQKGPAVAALYPNPLHREPGDIDFFFPADEFGRSRSFVEALSRDRGAMLHQKTDSAPAARGAAASVAAPCDPAPTAAYSPGSTPVTRWNVTGPVTEADGAFWYKFNGVTIEHHPVFYDCRCQFPSIDVKTPEATLLMLSTHILKHVLGKGIGLKQICDYFVAKRSLDYDPVLLNRLVAEAGLRKWQRLLDDFGPALRRIVAVEGNFGSMSSSSLGSGILLSRRSSSLGPGSSSSRRSSSLGSRTSPSRKPSSLGSRIHTAAAFCRKIPFALRYSPREWLHTVLLLSMRSR